MLGPMSPLELLRRGHQVLRNLRFPGSRALREGQLAMRVKPLWFSAYARYARALKALARSLAWVCHGNKPMAHRPQLAKNLCGFLDPPGETFGRQAFLFCEIMYFQLKDETDDLAPKRRNTVMNTMSNTCQAMST